jgi:hypothetical protein
MPAGLIEEQDCVCSGADLNRDLIEMELHGFAVAGWQHAFGLTSQVRQIVRGSSESGHRPSAKFVLPITVMPPGPNFLPLWRGGCQQLRPENWLRNVASIAPHRRQRSTPPLPRPRPAELAATSNAPNKAPAELAPAPDASERKPVASPPTEQSPEQPNIAEEVRQYVALGGPLGGGFAAPAFGESGLL